MSACPPLSADGPGGIAAVLRSVDCRSAEATAAAFGRLFGTDGRLGFALTALLTLFIAWMAIGLLTGRSRINLATISPRIMLLGVVLTFATSWIAYQSVVWNLAVGAPDQIAALLVGSRGSATMIFANRLDTLFTAIADAAQSAQDGGGDASGKGGAFTPVDLLWFGALLLLLGTVGVLIVARIALAALLALGPVFILLALFRGTRGLFEGWLRAVALFALTPLFAVLLGGAALAMLAPMIASLGTADLTMRTAVTIFLAATVHCGLMAIAFRMATLLTGGWRLPADRELDHDPGMAPATVPGLPPTPVDQAALSQRIESQDRVRALVAGLGMSRDPVPVGVSRTASVIAMTGQASAPAPVAAAGDDRARGLGGRYRNPPPILSRELLS